MKSFPGATSKELLHYFEPTLKDQSADTAVIHVGIKDKNIHSLDEQVTTLRNIALKCRSFAITKMCEWNCCESILKALTQKLERCIARALVDLSTIEIFKEYMYTKMVYTA